MPSFSPAASFHTFRAALRARPVVVILATALAAAVFLWLVVDRRNGPDTSESGPLLRAVQSGSSFRALPAGDLVFESSDAEATRAVRILLSASPELSRRISIWAAESPERMGIDSDSVERRAAVVRFGTDGRPESAMILEGQFASLRIREAVRAWPSTVEHYGGQEILTGEGRGAVAILDDRRVLVATNDEMARAAVDAGAGRDPSAATMDACVAMRETAGAAGIAGRIPAGANLTSLLPAHMSGAPFEGATIVATLESKDGFRLRLDMTHASPARAELAADRLRSEFVLDVLAIGAGRRVLDALAPYARVACDSTRVTVSLDIPREMLATVSAEPSGPDTRATLPPELLAPLPDGKLDPAHLPTAEAAAVELPPVPGVAGPVSNAAHATPIESHHDEPPRPFIWSPGETDTRTPTPSGVPRADRVASTLAAIADAERQFRETSGTYASLAELVRAGLLDPTIADGVVVDGYRLRLVSFDDRQYEATAEPASPSATPFVFGVREDGVVYTDSPPRARTGATGSPSFP